VDAAIAAPSSQRLTCPWSGAHFKHQA